jgi:hypothetical protein
MDPATILAAALRTAQATVLSSLGHSHTLTVLKLRELLWSTKITSALATSSDNCFAFAVRQARIALADAAAWPDTTLAGLRSILDDPALNAALGAPPKNSRARRSHRWD